ncbi:tyrosine-type recombinase/integrase [Chloroflexota bacterium]
MGHLRQRTKGSWQITIYQGYLKGKPVRYHETVKGTKEKAVKRMRELEYGLDHGIPTPSGEITVESYLISWLEGYVKVKCSLRTYDGYRSIIENHLIPNLGHLLLRKLQPETIEAFYGKACEKLSARTVQHHHRLLSEALKHAVRKGHLSRNPCDLAQAPSPRKRTMRTLTVAEVETMLTQAANNQFYPVYYAAVSTGLRQAELLGLRWRDVDLDGLSLSVSQVLYKRGGICVFKEPKTKGSSRRVDMTPKLALFLKQYKVQCEVLHLERGRILGLDDLVFASDKGKPLDPCTVTHNFDRIVRRAGLGKVRFHDLRHTFASIMLMKGAPAKVISECLGHASVAFTMDVYSHLLQGMQRDAMNLLDEVLPPAVSTTNERQNREAHD